MLICAFSDFFSRLTSKGAVSHHLFCLPRLFQPIHPLQRTCLIIKCNALIWIFRLFQPPHNKMFVFKRLFQSIRPMQRTMLITKRNLLICALFDLFSRLATKCLSTSDLFSRLARCSAQFLLQSVMCPVARGSTFSAASQLNVCPQATSSVGSSNAARLFYYKVFFSHLHIVKLLHPPCN